MFAPFSSAFVAQLSAFSPEVRSQQFQIRFAQPVAGVIALMPIRIEQRQEADIIETLSLLGRKLQICGS